MVVRASGSCGRFPHFSDLSANGSEVRHRGVDQRFHRTKSIRDGACHPLGAGGPKKFATGIFGRFARPLPVRLAEVAGAWDDLAACGRRMPTLRENLMKKRTKTTKSEASSPKAAKGTLTGKSHAVTHKSLKKAVSAGQVAAPAQASGRMTVAEVMGILESLGSEQTRRTWTRHGAGEPMFGVLFGELYKLMKRIDVDHELAQQLWATGNVDARNLAMKIADPAVMTPAELTQWAIENPMRMCNLYIATLAAEGPHARVLLKEWLQSSNERLLASGWTLLGRLSDLDLSFSEQELLRGIGEIEKTIHAVANEVRSDMNRTLITIGGRSIALRKAVVAAAKRIGSVQVNHGDTACKTPQIEESLQKAWARYEAKYGSPAAHERSMKSMRRRC